MKLNRDGMEKAKSMIGSRQYVLESAWGDVNPSAQDENDFLEKHGWDEYGKWYLGHDEEANPQTKARYSFPYGDFRRVHRSGLLAAKQRAAQLDYEDIEKAADELLALLDEQGES